MRVFCLLPFSFAFIRYRGARCTRTSPLPLLPSGPGGVRGIASRGSRYLTFHFSIGAALVPWAGTAWFLICHRFSICHPERSEGPAWFLICHPERSEGPAWFLICHPERSEGPASRLQN